MLGCWILFIAGAFFPAHNVYPAEMEILSTAGQAREGRAKEKTRAFDAGSVSIVCFVFNLSMDTQHMLSSFILSATPAHVSWY